MRIFDLALKDLSQIFRDWKAALFLLIMPVVFTLLFGAIFSGTNSGGEDSRIPVGFIDQDAGVISPYFRAILENSDEIRPETLEGEADTAKLEEMVTAGDYAAVVIVPAGYSKAQFNGSNPKLSVIINPDSGLGATVQSSLQTAVNRLVKLSEEARFSLAARENIKPFGDDGERMAYFDQALALAADQWESPSFNLTVSQTGVVEEQDNGFGENPYAHSSVGMMLQFAIAGLIGAAEVLVIERKSRSLQRLLTTPIRRSEVLLGHFLAMFAMVFLQLAVLIVFGQLVLDVSYFSAPLGTLLMVIGTTLFVASLGLLIGSLAKTPEHVVLYSLLPMFILSGLGGAWVPLEFTNATFEMIGHFTPLAWAMDGFKNIVVRGQGTTAILLPMGVLLAFAVVLFGISVWQFNRSEEV